MQRISGLILLALSCLAWGAPQGDWQVTTSKAEKRGYVLAKLYGGIRTREAWDLAFDKELARDDAAALAYLFKRAAALGFKIDLNRVNEAGDMPLHQVLQHSRGYSIEVLIKNGADVNTYNRAGFTPLHLGVRTQNLGAVKRLCAVKGLLPDYKVLGQSDETSTAFWWAALSRNGEMVKAILNSCHATASAEMDQKLFQLDSAEVLEARWPSSSEMVRVVLSNKDNRLLADLVIKHKTKALKYLVSAFEKERKSAKGELLQSLNTQMGSAYAAAVKNSEEDALGALSGFPNIFFIASTYSRTPVFEDAIALSDLDFFKVFLKQCPYIGPFEKDRLLKFSKEVSSAEKTALLENYIRDPNCKRAGLDLAPIADEALTQIQAGEDLPRYPELEKGGWASIKLRSGDYYIPLLAVAAAAGNTKVVKSLLRFGADPNEQAGGKNSVSDYALQGMKDSVILALLDAGGFQHAYKQVEQRALLETIVRYYSLPVLKRFAARKILPFDTDSALAGKLLEFSIQFDREEIFDWIVNDEKIVQSARSAKDIGRSVAKRYKSSVKITRESEHRFAGYLKTLDRLGFEFNREWEAIHQTCNPEVIDHFRSRMLTTGSATEFDSALEAACIDRDDDIATVYWNGYLQKARAQTKLECKTDLTTVALQFARDRELVQFLLDDLATRMINFSSRVLESQPLAMLQDGLSKKAAIEILSQVVLEYFDFKTEPKSGPWFLDDMVSSLRAQSELSWGKDGESGEVVACTNRPFFRARKRSEEKYEGAIKEKLKHLCKLGKAGKVDRWHASKFTLVGFDFHIWVVTGPRKIDLFSDDYQGMLRELGKNFDVYGTHFDIVLEGELFRDGLLAMSPWTSISMSMPVWSKKFPFGFKWPNLSSEFANQAASRLKASGLSDLKTYVGRYWPSCAQP